MVFAIHWHESAMSVHVFPILNPPPTSLPIPSLWVIPLHQPLALVSCIQHGLAICFTYDNIHVSMLFSQIIPPLPSTESKSLLYICLFCCLTYRVIVTIFLNSVYMRYDGVGISCSVMPDSLRPHGLQPTRLLCLWDFPGKDTGVGHHFLLQGIFPTQGSNPGILHCRQILYQLSYKGSPIYMLWETLNKNCLVEHHLITGWQ